MIKVLIKGHDFKYDVFELIRSLYEDNNIEFIEDEALVNNQSLLIENNLYKKNETYEAETVIKKDFNIISKSVDNIINVDIKKDNDKKNIKTLVKQSLFNAITKTLDNKPSWGILTGIRPSKIVHELLDKNIEIKEVKDILMNQYKISEEKTNLLISIVKGERSFIYPLDEDKFSLYISIPFCPTRCIYCSFPSNSLNKSSNLVNIYIEKLLYEIEEIGKLTKDMKLETVYIGGGTPTSISNNDLERIIKKIYKVFSESTFKEFTVEAGRPDTIDIELLNMLKSNGVERISINPQTMCNKTLEKIGRNHTREDIIKTYKLAKRLGFIINMDLIVGLPEEGIQEIEYTMKEIKKLDPDNLTVHTLAIKKASKLMEKERNYKLAMGNDIKEMLKITKKYSKEMKMYPYYLYRQKKILGNYENVGYCKPKKECIYNMLIMEEKQTIIAAGAGAVSKIYSPDSNKIQRVPNVKGLNEYIKRNGEMIERKKKHLLTY
ncbi:MAG: coproporphyrinogen dehydrogenase HemZ [Firmicutes bacterium]|nr:coproporphyrinogen dehydrogenase HemZ [Bacillota bacterium]